MNLNQSNQEKDINARNKGVTDSNRSKLIGAIGSDIGAIGKELTFKQMVKDSGLCYDTAGAYICGTDQRLTNEEVNEIKSETNDKAQGGMLNSNSMFNSYLEFLKKK